MSWDASITIAGNVTSDPELRFTQNGKSVLGFGLAVNRKGPNGDEEVDFFDITAWGHLAEKAADHVAKGQRVVVFGDPRQERWEDPNGQKRSKVKVWATEIGLSVKFMGEQVAAQPARVTQLQPQQAQVAAPQQPVAASPYPTQG